MQGGAVQMVGKIRIHKPRVDVITAVCLLMFLMHLFVVLTGGIFAHEVIYNQWMGLKASSLFQGKIWQLVTYSFLHGNWLHLLTNLAMTWLIGGRLMTILSQKKVALCLLLGSVVGGLFFVGFDLLTDKGALLVGASGSALALFILMACLSPSAKMFPIPIQAKNMAIGVLAASLILCLVHPSLNLPILRDVGIKLYQVGMVSIFQVAHACHLGGGLIGFWISKLIMGRMISLDDLKRSRIH